MASYSNLLKYGKKTIKETDWSKLLPTHWDWKKIIWPFRVLVHPVQAFNEIKYEKKGSVPLSILILLLWFFSNIFKFLETGFQFNTQKVETLSAQSQFMGSAMVIILWTIANWAICTLMDGEGWFKEIWIACCYSVMPQVITIIPVAVISKVLTIEEGAFVNLITTIAFAWMVLLLFIANTVIHQYSFIKSFASMVLTVFGVFVLLLLIVLIVSLFVQMWDFIEAIVSELRFRL